MKIKTKKSNISKDNTSKGMSEGHRSTGYRAGHSSRPSHTVGGHSAGGHSSSGASAPHSSGAGHSSAGGAVSTPAETAEPTPTPSLSERIQRGDFFVGEPGTAMTSEFGTVAGATAGHAFEGSISSGVGAQREQTFYKGEKLTDTARVKVPGPGGESIWVAPTRVGAYVSPGSTEYAEAEQKFMAMQRLTPSSAEAIAKVEEARQAKAGKKAYVPLQAMAVKKLEAKRSFLTEPMVEKTISETISLAAAPGKIQTPLEIKAEAKSADIEAKTGATGEVFLDARADPYVSPIIYKTGEEVGGLTGVSGTDFFKLAKTPYGQYSRVDIPKIEDKIGLSPKIPILGDKVVPIESMMSMAPTVKPMRAPTDFVSTAPFQGTIQKTTTFKLPVEPGMLEAAVEYKGPTGFGVGTATRMNLARQIASVNAEVIRYNRGELLGDPKVYKELEIKQSNLLAEGRKTAPDIDFTNLITPLGVSKEKGSQETNPLQLYADMQLLDITPKTGLKQTITGGDPRLLRREKKEVTTDTTSYREEIAGPLTKQSTALETDIMGFIGTQGLIKQRKDDIIELIFSGRASDPKVQKQMQSLADEIDVLKAKEPVRGVWEDHLEVGDTLLKQQKEIDSPTSPEWDAHIAEAEKLMAKRDTQTSKTIPGYNVEVALWEKKDKILKQEQDSKRVELNKKINKWNIEDAKLKEYAEGFKSQVTSIKKLADLDKLLLAQSKDMTEKITRKDITAGKFEESIKGMKEAPHWFAGADEPAKIQYLPEVAGFGVGRLGQEVGELTLFAPSREIGKDIQEKKWGELAKTLYDPGRYVRKGLKYSPGDEEYTGDLKSDINWRAVMGAVDIGLIAAGPIAKAAQLGVTSAPVALGARVGAASKLGKAAVTTLKVGGKLAVPALVAGPDVYKSLAEGQSWERSIANITATTAKFGAIAGASAMAMGSTPITYRTLQGGVTAKGKPTDVYRTIAVRAGPGKNEYAVISRVQQDTLFKGGKFLTGTKLAGKKGLIYQEAAKPQYTWQFFKTPKVNIKGTHYQQQYLYTGPESKVDISPQGLVKIGKKTYNIYKSPMRNDIAGRPHVRLGDKNYLLHSEGVRGYDPILVKTLSKNWKASVPIKQFKGYKGALEIAKGTGKTPSEMPFKEVKTLVGPTQTVDSGTTREMMEFLNQYYGKYYGSFSTAKLLKGTTYQHYLGQKNPGDIDWESLRRLATTEKIAKGAKAILKKKGYNAFITADKPALVQIKTADGKIHHALDAHSLQSPETTAEGFGSVMFSGKTFKVKDPELTRIMGLGEQSQRKLESMFILRKVGDKMYFAPEVHRLKDIPSGLMAAEGAIKGTKGGTKFMKSFGAVKGMYPKALQTQTGAFWEKAPGVVTWASPSAGLSAQQMAVGTAFMGTYGSPATVPKASLGVMGTHIPLSEFYYTKPPLYEPSPGFYPSDAPSQSLTPYTSPSISPSISPYITPSSYSSLGSESPSAGYPSSGGSGSGGGSESGSTSISQYYSYPSPSPSPSPGIGGPVGPLGGFLGGGGFFPKGSQYWRRGKRFRTWLVRNPIKTPGEIFAGGISKKQVDTKLSGLVGLSKTNFGKVNLGKKLKGMI